MIEERVDGWRETSVKEERHQWDGRERAEWIMVVNERVLTCFSLKAVWTWVGEGHTIKTQQEEPVKAVRPCPAAHTDFGPDLRPESCVTGSPPDPLALRR